MSLRKLFSLRYLVFAAVLGAASLTRTFAQTTYSWTNATGNWSVGSNWAGNVAPVGITPTDALVFSGSGYTATNDQPATPFMLNRMILNASGTASINASTGSSKISFLRDNAGITQNGSGSVSMSIPIFLQHDLNLSGSGAGSVLLGSITGAADIIKNGTSTFSLSTGDTWLGSLVIQNGTIRPAGLSLRTIPVSISVGGSLLTSSDIFLGGLSGTGGLVESQVVGTNAANRSIRIYALSDGAFAGTLRLGPPTGTGADSGQLIIEGPGLTTLTGTTTIEKNVVIGGRVVLGGTASLGAQTKGVVQLTGGSLTLDNTTTNLTDRLRDAADDSTSLEPLGGGSLMLDGNTAGSSETFGRIQLGGDRSGRLKIEVRHRATASATTLTARSYVRDATTAAPYSTVEFVATDGTGSPIALGTAGNSARILFVTAPTLSNGLLAKTSGNAEPGWAVVSDATGLSPATYGANGIAPIAPTSTNLSTATAADHVRLTGSSTVDSATAASLTLAPSASGQSLSLGTSGVLDTTCIVLSGSRSFSINNGTLGGNGPRYIHVAAGATLTLNCAIGNSQPIIKSGDGTLVLTNTNNSSGTQPVIINAGILRTTSAGAEPGEVRMRGGSWEVINSSVTRNAGTGSNTFNWSTGSEGGGGGFVAATQSITVSPFNGITWGGFGPPVGSPLVVGANAGFSIAFNGPLQLSSSGHRLNEVRTLGAGFAAINGVILGDSTTNLLKTGPGTLIITSVQTWSGSTIVQEGTFIVNGSLSQTNLIDVRGGAKLAGSGTAKDIVLQSGGTLSPSGTLTASSLTWRGGATCAFGLNPNGTSSVLSLGTGSLRKEDGGTGYYVDLQNTGTAGRTYTVITFSTTDFASQDFTPINVPEGLAATVSVDFGALTVSLATVTPAVPVTGTATSITTSSATLNGTVNPSGFPAIARFEYGLDTNYGSSVDVSPAPGSGNTATPVFVVVTGLQPNQTYHYRLVATNGAGSVNGSDQTFSTPPLPPTVQTTGVSNVASTSVTLLGTVNPNGVAASVFMEYGTTTSYGTTTTAVPLAAGSTAQSIEVPISNLNPGQTYNFRIVATSTGGRSDGANIAFTTMVGPNGPPIISAAGFTSVGQTGATLTGTLNPNGGATAVRFRYGTTSTFDGSWLTSDVRDVGSGNSDVDISIPITGLNPTTTYYFRLDATNPANTSTRTGGPFTTLNPPAPTVTNLAATGVDQTVASLSASVSANGGPTTVRFEYGLDAGASTVFGSQTAIQNLLANAANQAVAANLTGLTAGKTYRFRVVAANAGGATQPESTFTTQPPPPTITNVTPDPIGPTFATLRAKVNANGKSTTAYFEYGPDTNYGTTKPVQTVGTGNSDVDLAEALNGLVAGTTVHFRVVATSLQGTTTGDDATFTTLSAQDPEAVADFLFVGSLVTPASRNLLANDVNHDYPPTTNQDLSFVTFLLDRQLPIVAQGSVAGDGNVTYTRFSTFKFDTANFPPNPSDVFGYRITTPAGKTADGQVKVYHFGSFKGSFGGVINGGTQDDGGAITLELTSSGDSTMKLVWQGIDYSNKPQINGAGQLAGVTGTLPIPKRNSAVSGKNLVLKLQLQPDGSIPGTLEDQETQKTFTFTLRRAGLATDDDPKAQQFTATMDQLPDALAEGATRAENVPRGSITPQQVTGFGFYLAKLSKARNKLNARFSGGMPDQQKFSSGSKVFGDRVLLNQRLYQRGRNFGGRVFGESTLVRRASFTSTLEWIKKTSGLFGPPPPTVAPRILPFDFHNALSLAGDSYQKTGDLPPVQRFTLDFGSTLEVRFSAGGLAVEQTALFTLRQAGAGFKVIAGDTTFAKKPTFKVNAATGMFSGTFVHPDTQRYKTPLKFSGAFRRNPDASYDVKEKGRGSFLGFDNAGYVRVFAVR